MRLIDADALKKNMEFVCMGIMAGTESYKAPLKEIDNAPTIDTPNTSNTPNTLGALESIQTTQLTDEDKETIRIHLNAFKESLCNQGRWYEATEYEELIHRLLSTSSVQPELSSNSKELEKSSKELENKNGELISREYAIDDLHGRDPSQIWDTADIEVWLNALPSAQFERDIPIKPIETTDKAWGIPHKQAVCPKCDYYLSHISFLGDYKGKRITYCETCGQAIDWEGWDFDE